MRLSPEDRRLRREIRNLVAVNLSGGGERVLFVDDRYQAREVLYESEIRRGGHLHVRDQLIGAAQLQAILHLGLVGTNRALVHVTNPDPRLDLDPERQSASLYCLRQTKDQLRWVPCTQEAQDAWLEAWFRGH